MSSREERNRKIGERLRTARGSLRPERSQQWVVTELAAGGIKRTQEWLSKVERGTRTLSAPDAQALAHVLGVAAGHLLGDQDVTGRDLGAGLRAFEEDLTERDKEELLQIARLKAELNREVKRQGDSGEH